MSGDETRLKPHEDSDSEEEPLDPGPSVDVNIDPSKLTPLSPEVISKQASFGYG
jgi:translation initiation factor 2 subunit 3